MSSRNQNRPPPTPVFDPTPSPLNKKENLDEAPVDKRRKIRVGRMVCPATNPHARQVLSTVNAGPNPGGHGDHGAGAAPSSDGGSSGGGVEFTSREDVERLLGEKMKGKNKNDYKGKSEQMIEYIKKLRTCIRWFMELEDGYLADQEKLRSMLDSEEKRHAEIEAQMRAKVEELNAIIHDLQKGGS
ncbi:kinesin-like protein KIN-14H isoform X1 [Phoenix dactylifera]|uniref:Kinesin-like protein KIN-14H isoform X1 n=1 Tax=Phoenix dactylifera TaxID=42345 RepID=A0A8B8ZG01_PHODC|nr:kinesin-like protein KIN-14H isoform X1 [Phoenix dactylifera]XP_038973080.1 kinesin-like protein KIN-14H isoform X1 [Phoenix dactylifera]XP_038973081.1 kinesin-like protein KIN-14H isoform X1 [Phoenix dactylifera]